MTKKEKIKAEYDRNTDKIPYPVDRVLWAIIDALPDEPETPSPTEFCPKHRFAYDVGAHCPGCVVGPEPVAETVEAAILAYTIAKGFERMDAFFRQANLGQRSDPPATSGATQAPLTPYGEECERKLRIMKAMEAFGKGSKFYLSENGEWYYKGPFGDSRINDHYSPRENEMSNEAINREPKKPREVWIHINPVGGEMNIPFDQHTDDCRECPHCRLFREA